MNSLNKDEYQNCYRAKYESIINFENYMYSFMVTSSLHTIAELRVAEKLGTDMECKRSVNEIASEVEANADSLYRLMKALTSFGFFEEAEPRTFKHTDLSIVLCDPYVRNQMMMAGSNTFLLGFKTLTDSVKSGQSQVGKGLDSTNFWEYLKKNPSEQTIFGKGMSSIAMRMAPIVSKLYDYNQFDTVCDVGGSQGILISEILKHYPNIKHGINFDLPHVLNELKSEKGRHWTDSRFSEVAGSFFDSVPPADCYVLKSIFHDWDDEKSRAILEVLAKSIRPNGQVHIVELVTDHTLKGDEPFVSLMDLRMLQFCNARERNRKEWEELISGTPFKIESINLSNHHHCQNLIILIKK